MVVTLNGIAAEEDAQEYAVYWHGNQKDKVGNVYEEHLRAVGDIAVSLQVKKFVTYCESESNLRTAGWLHDVVEDTSVKHEDLKERGYNTQVLKIVEAITKRPNEQQTLYLARLIVAGRGAMLLKLADLYHNTMIWRLRLLDGNTQVRLLTKYTKAIGALEALLEVSDGVRRYWFLRQYLASLKAQGYKEYSTTYSSGSGYDSYGASSWSAETGWTSQQKKWDTRQQEMVTPLNFIGGPSWDGWYRTPDASNADGYRLTRTEADKDGWVIPPDHLIYKKIPGPNAAKSGQLALPATPSECKNPGAHASSCRCGAGSPKASYTPSVDYQFQKSATENKK